MYVKLWCDILDSSLWLDQSAETRIVWITLLAMADADGMVRATEKAISRRAVVSQEKTSKALELFQSADPDSRNRDNDGRRLEKVPGGYLLLRYTELAKLKTRAEQQEASRRRVAAFRERKKVGHKAQSHVTHVTNGAEHVTNVTNGPEQVPTKCSNGEGISVTTQPATCDGGESSDNVTPNVTNVTNVTYSDADADADADVRSSSASKKAEAEEDSSGQSPDQAKTDAPPFQQIANYWNGHERLSNYRHCNKLTTQRKKHLRARWKEPLFRDNWQKIIDLCEMSDFLVTDCKPFNFTWWIKNAENYVKILEGNYANDQAKGKGARFAL